MKLMLHIGLEKTGSTYLQGKMYGAREALRRHGIACAGPEGWNTPRAEWLLMAYQSRPRHDTLSIGNKEYAHKVDFSSSSNLQTFLEIQCCSVLAQPQWVWLSEERLATRLSESEINKLLGACRRGFQQICVVFVERNYESLITSLYSEALKAGTVEEEDQWKTNTEYLNRDLSSYVRLWRRCVGPDIEFTVVSEDCYKRDKNYVLTYMLSRMGITAELQEHVIKASEGNPNASFNVLGKKVMLFLNRSGVSNVRLRRLIIALLKFLRV